MAKWCFNYESGEYEYIEKDGFSIDRGEYVYNLLYPMDQHTIR